MAEVAVWGAWHLGPVIAAGLAALGHRVMLTDLEPAVRQVLRAGSAPVREPGLDDLIRDEAESDRLSVLDPDDKRLGRAPYTVIALDVEVDEQDRPVLDGVDRLAMTIAEVLSSNTLLVVMSQVPVGTSSALAQRLSAEGRAVRVAHIPENLRLGNALEGFFHPDRIVIGADDDQSAEEAASLFAKLGCPIVRMGVLSAEMSKHALNVYLATCISFMSELSAVCEQVGADAWDVLAAMRADRRVSPHAPLAPGLGFAGGTLGRDVQSLRHVARQHGLRSDLFDAVLRVNRRRLVVLAQRIRRIVGGDEEPTVALLGLTYKPGTDTLRRSQSLELARLLLEEGVQVRAHDPAVHDGITGRLDIPVLSDPYEAGSGAGAAILMTEWPEYRELDFRRLAAAMARPVLVDPGGFLDGAALHAAGIRREVFGEP